MSRLVSYYPLAIVLIGSLFLFKLWTSEGIVYSSRSDTIAMAAGIRATAMRTFSEEGKYALWDPSYNCGSPAHANPLAMYTFPLHWPYFLMSADKATNLVVILHVLLAGLTMFFFSRRFLKEPAAAFFCAVAYMLCHRSLSMIDAGWLQGPMSMYALMPLLFLALDRLIEKASAARICQCAVVLALSLSQGYMQTFYYGLICGFFFTAHRLNLNGLGRRAWPRVICALAAAGALAVLLAAPDLLPRLEFTSLSSRVKYDYSFFLNHSPSWSSLKTLLDPMDEGGKRYEYWESNFYFGIWIIPLCLVAMVKERRRNLLLAASAVGLLLVCFNTPVLKLLYEYLPGFKLFRSSSRILPLAQLVLTLLAGRGMDALLAGHPNRILRICASFFWILPVLDSGLRMMPRLGTLPLSRAFPVHDFHATIKRRADNGRVAAIGRDVVPYGMANYFGIDMANGYAPLNLKHYVEYFGVLKYGNAGVVPRGPAVWMDLDSIARPSMIRALDVETIVASEPYPLEKLGFRREARFDKVPIFSFYRGIVDNPVYVWRDTHPLGPAYFASSLHAAADETASLTAIARADSVLEAHVLGLEPNDARKTGFSGGKAWMIKRGYNDYSYSLESRGDNFLILSQVWYPGWRASLDGHPIELYRTNHALLGCFVPDGRHSLELTMTSPPLRLGLILFGIGLAVLCLLWLSSTLCPPQRLRRAGFSSCSLFSSS